MCGHFITFTQPGGSLTSGSTLLVVYQLYKQKRQQITAKVQIHQPGDEIILTQIQFQFLSRQHRRALQSDQQFVRD